MSYITHFYKCFMEKTLFSNAKDNVCVRIILNELLNIINGLFFAFNKLGGLG